MAEDEDALYYETADKLIEQANNDLEQGFKAVLDDDKMYFAACGAELGAVMLCMAKKVGDARDIDEMDALTAVLNGMISYVQYTLNVDVQQSKGAENTVNTEG